MHSLSRWGLMEFAVHKDSIQLPTSALPEEESTCGQKLTDEHRILIGLFVRIVSPLIAPS